MFQDMGPIVGLTESDDFQANVERKVIRSVYISGGSQVVEKNLSTAI